jgi:hypothetical protein
LPDGLSDLPDGLSCDFPVQPFTQKYSASRLTQINFKSIVAVLLAEAPHCEVAEKVLAAGNVVKPNKTALEHPAGTIKP